MAGNLCILNKTIMAKINSKVKNSRVSIKGKDIILDYEFFLHNYLNEAELRQKGLVPVEMYPYEGDVIVGYLPVDEQFGCIDLEALYKWAIERIEKENPFLYHKDLKILLIYLINKFLLMDNLSEE